MPDFIKMLQNQLDVLGGEEGDLEVLLRPESLRIVSEAILREAHIYQKGIFEVIVPKKILPWEELLAESGITWSCSKSGTAEMRDLVCSEQEALRGVRSYQIRVFRIQEGLGTAEVLSSMDQEKYEPARIIDLLLLKIQFADLLGKLRMVELGTLIGDLVVMVSYLQPQDLYEFFAINSRRKWPVETCFPFRVRKSERQLT